MCAAGGAAGGQAAGLPPAGAQGRGGPDPRPDPRPAGRGSRCGQVCLSPRARSVQPGRGDRSWGKRPEPQWDGLAGPEQRPARPPPALHPQPRAAGGGGAQPRGSGWGGGSGEGALRPENTPPPPGPCAPSSGPTRRSSSDPGAPRNRPRSAPRLAGTHLKLGRGEPGVSGGATHPAMETPAPPPLAQSRSCSPSHRPPRASGSPAPRRPAPLPGAPGRGLPAAPAPPPRLELLKGAVTWRLPLGPEKPNLGP